MLVFLALQGSFILFVSIVINGMNSTYLAFESSRATAEGAGECHLLNAAVECCGGEADLEHPVGPYSVLPHRKNKQKISIHFGGFRVTMTPF